MNPIIKTVFAADASAHVWENDPDTLWLYTSHDEPNANTHDGMQSYHVFSTKNMVDYTDHGRVFHLSQASWAVSHMWAVDAVFRHGKYYLTYCAVERATSQFRTGIAVSDQPQGPFDDLGYIKGIEWGQDPALFVDDDDTPYLFWGCGGQCFGCRLTDDLMSRDGEVVDLAPQLKWVFEGPFVHKYKNKYYLTYPGLYENKWPEIMYYAMADSPLGEYKFCGEYIPLFEGHSGTNHGSILKFKDRWYAVHHSAWLTGQSECRCLMCDYLEYNADGTIKPIIPDKNGVHSTENESIYEGKTTLLLDASVVHKTGGAFMGTHSTNGTAGYTGHGCAEGFGKPYFGIDFLAISGIERKAKLKLRYRAEHSDVKIYLMVNNIMVFPYGVKYEEHDNKFHVLPQSADWQEIYLPDITLKAVDNHIRLYNSDTDFQLDCVIIEEY